MIARKSTTRHAADWHRLFAARDFPILTHPRLLSATVRGGSFDEERVDVYYGMGLRKIEGDETGFALDSRYDNLRGASGSVPGKRKLASSIQLASAYSKYEKKTKGDLAWTFPMGSVFRWESGLDGNGYSIPSSLIPNRDLASPALSRMITCRNKASPEVPWRPRRQDTRCEISSIAHQLSNK